MKMALGVAFLFAVNFLPTVSEAKGGGYSGTTHVNGYTNSHGTYVEPHYRTAPNNTTSDNWSHSGNVNPYTGKVGDKND